MRRDQLAHLVRAAGAILDTDAVLVIGSQAILGSYDHTELPEATVVSVEADLLTRDGSAGAADLIDDVDATEDERAVRRELVGG